MTSGIQVENEAFRHERTETAGLRHGRLNLEVGGAMHSLGVAAAWRTHIVSESFQFLTGGRNDAR